MSGLQLVAFHVWYCGTEYRDKSIKNEKKNTD